MTHKKVVVFLATLFIITILSASCNTHKRRTIPCPSFGTNFNIESPGHDYNSLVAVGQTISADGQVLRYTE
ncbi:MAG: hypothetical protein U9N85_12355 [Bacteroidota bacterium]|nr:hypothetical protein [Bacteroidota bacterium]